MSVSVVPIGGIVLPDDLVAPLGGDGCCGPVWLASIEDVADAAAGVAPLVSPCCGTRFRPRDLGAMLFFSRREWDEAPDDDPPLSYRVGHAFTMPPTPRSAS